MLNKILDYILYFNYSAQKWILYFICNIVNKDIDNATNYI